MPGAILIVEDDLPTAEDLRRYLSPEYECHLAHTVGEAVGAARRTEIVAALVDLDLQTRTDGFTVVSELRRIDPRTAILIVTNDTSEESIRKARDLEVQDYIPKSIGAAELRRALHRSLVLRRVSERARRLEEERAGGTPRLVADSPAMKTVTAEAERAARHRAPVLITGPVGSGKMIVARAIHALSRPDRPFEAVHCATLDTELVDSQLFGYEPGAHSTATQRFIGAFERVEDGTLVLDDLDCLPLRIQAKLLQPLEERRIRRLPGSVEVPIRCRVLATTNKDLDRLVAAGSFSADLLSRLRGGQEIRVPAIETRREDLPGLVRALVRRAVEECGKRLPEITPAFLEAVTARRWTDARQLQNAIHYAVGLSEGTSLQPESLPEIGREGSIVPSGAADPAEALLDGDLETVLERTRLAAVRRALVRCGGDKKAAAAALGITVQWLNAILRGEREGAR